MRYEYRDAYLSARASRLAVRAPQMRPAKSCSSMHRNQDSGKTTATLRQKPRARTAMGLHATRDDTGDSSTDGPIFFRLYGGRLSEADEDALKKLLTPLIRESETPFDKWVTVSDDLLAYNSLSRGQEEANWEAIVDRISANDMQFSNDFVLAAQTSESECAGQACERRGDCRRRQTAETDFFPLRVASR